MIRIILRGIRGDLRISRRPACSLILFGVLVLTGLLSLMMQQSQHGQLDVAAWGVEYMEGELARCEPDDNRCVRVGEQDVKFANRFLQEQTAEAERIGQLQQTSGALRFGSASAGLAIGFLAVLSSAHWWLRWPVVRSFRFRMRRAQLLAGSPLWLVPSRRQRPTLP